MGKDKKPNEPIMRRALASTSVVASETYRSWPTTTTQSWTSLLSALLFAFIWIRSISAVYALWTSRKTDQWTQRWAFVKLASGINFGLHDHTLETPRLLSSSSWQIVSLSNRDSASNCSCRFSRSCYFLAGFILSLANLLSEFVTKLKLNYLK